MSFFLKIEEKSFSFIDLQNKELSIEELKTYTEIKEKYGRFLITRPFNYNFLALTKYKGIFLGKFEDLKEVPNLEIKGIIKVYSNSEISKEEKKEIIKKLLNKIKISFDPKGKKLIVYKYNDFFLLGLSNWEREKFSSRDPNKRPFNRPYTLKPKFARALVNIAYYNTIVDPFVGTGTILIEAKLTNRDYFGIDRDWNSLKGCIKNLEFFGLKKKVVLSDSINIKNLLCNLNKKKNFAIVTDPPYGKSSSLFGKKLEELYSQFLEQALSLDNMKKMIFISRKENDLNDLILSFKPKKYIDFYVNSNMTRRIFIFETH